MASQLQEDKYGRKIVRGFFTKILPILAIATLIVLSKDLLDYLFPQHKWIARATVGLALLCVWGGFVLYGYFKFRKTNNKE